MRTCVLVFVTMFCSFDLHAYPVMGSYRYTPYPPGCATVPDVQTSLYGDNMVKFFDGRITLSSPSNVPRDANLAVYRVACAEPDRSVIWFVFSIPDDVDPATEYRTPNVSANGAGMILAREPNTWGIGIEPWFYHQTFGVGADASQNGHDAQWIFVLENPNQIPCFCFVLNLASDYNENLTLIVDNGLGGAGETIDLPPTSSVMTANPTIPLNGRLSGNWVMEGIPDQGLLISVSEHAAAQNPSALLELQDSNLLMFLSWYTYDASGELLWLTGAAEFALGATQVTVPIELVSNGEFFGSKPADREVVGSVTLTGNSCNDLGFQYDLGGIGLGSGSQHLKRLFSLETAGYVCRDLEARALEEGK